MKPWRLCGAGGHPSLWGAPSYLCWEEWVEDPSWRNQEGHWGALSPSGFSGRPEAAAALVLRALPAPPEMWGLAAGGEGEGWRRRGTQISAVSLVLCPQEQGWGVLGLSVPLPEEGDYPSDLVSMSWGDKGEVASHLPCHICRGLPTDASPPSSDPTPSSGLDRDGASPCGSPGLGSKPMSGLWCGPLHPALPSTLREAPPAAKSKGVTPQTPSHLPGKTAQVREQSAAQLPRAPVQQPCPHSAGVGRGEVPGLAGRWWGMGRAGAGGTHCSLEPASPGFQDNLREGRGGTGPPFGL